MFKLQLKLPFLVLLFLSSACISYTSFNFMVLNKQRGNPDNNFNEVPLKIPKIAENANLGAWIIIAGDRSDHDKIELIKYGCDRVYEYLRDLGVSSDDIYYLAPDYGDISPYVDAFTTHANIIYALETWAVNKVDDEHGLGMYLFDHGGVNYMCLPGTPELTSDQLDDSLENIETETGCNRFIIIYEACHSGSFIDDLSQENRIILTATDVTHGSSVNPDWTWASFSEGFWSSIAQGHTVGEAFEDAVQFVDAAGYGDTQFPWIDDNHDFIGHEINGWGALPNGGDGNDALNLYLGSGLMLIDPIIIYYPRWWFIHPDIYEIPIWMRIDTKTEIEKAFVRIIPPTWVPSEIQYSSAQSEELDGSTLMGDKLPLITLSDQKGDGNYTGSLNRKELADYTTALGTYQICMYAKSTKGTISQVYKTHMTINDKGIQPDDDANPIIRIINPKLCDILSGEFLIEALGDDNYGLDTVELLFDGKSLIKEKMPDILPYPQVRYKLNTKDFQDGFHEITARAVDLAGNKAETRVRIYIDNDGKTEDVPSDQTITNASTTDTGEEDTEVTDFNIEISGYRLETISIFGLIAIIWVILRKNTCKPSR